MANIFESVAIKSLTAPVNSTSTVTSTAQDVSGYTGSAFYIHYGDSADTLAADLYWEGKLKESATSGGAFTDVSSDDVSTDTNSFGLVNAPTEDEQIFSVRYLGSQKFVKVEVTATGTHSSGTPIGITCALGLPRSQTTDQPSDP